jgi:hypothetical protein
MAVSLADFPMPGKQLRCGLLFFPNIGKITGNFSEVRKKGD